MDRSPTPAPSLISSLEAMIQASVAAALQHQLGPVNKPLNTQMEEAVTAVLDRLLGPLRDSLNAQIEATVDAALYRRLSTMSSTLNTRFRPLVDAALERRLGPVGSPLNALITLNVPQPISTTLTKNHGLVVPQTALAVPLTTDRMQAVITTQRKITPELKKEASKEPEMSYRKFVGGVEVVNLKAAGGSELRNTSLASVLKATPRTLDNIEKA